MIPDLTRTSAGPTLSSPRCRRELDPCVMSLELRTAAIQPLSKAGQACELREVREPSVWEHQIRKVAFLVCKIGITAGCGCIEAGGAFCETRVLGEHAANEGLNYSDAVKLLGGSDSRVVAAIDKLAGGVLLAAAAGVSVFALGLFKAKAEFIRLSMDLVSSLTDTFRGLDRFSRSERLAAAQAVLVLVAYFEELDRFESTAAGDPGLPYSVRAVMRQAGKRKPRKPDQVSLVAGTPAPSAKLGSLVRGLLHDELPAPVPQYPYEVTLERISELYGRLSTQLSAYVVGQESWDALDPDDRKAFQKAFQENVGRRAVGRYEELFRRLAAQFPEVAFWANLVDHQATRGEIRELRAGLAGLERAFAAITMGRAADDRRSAFGAALPGSP